MTAAAVGLLSLSSVLSLSLLLPSITPPTTPVARVAAPHMYTPFESAIKEMNYRELQAECKARGIGAKGKADELRSRLLELSSPSDSSADQDDAFDDLLPITLEGEEEGPAAKTGPAAAEAEAEADPEVNDSLFDELLRELDEPFDAPAGAAGASPGGDPSFRASYDGGLSNALDGLDDLGIESSVADDLGLGGGSGGGSSPSFDSASSAATDDVDFLDDLFGPPTASPLARPARRPTSRGSFASHEEEGDHDEELWSDDPNGSRKRAILFATRSGDARHALQKLASWRDDALPVDSRLYLAGLDSCERLGEWEMACELINELEEARQELTTDHFDAALRACDKGSRWQEALRLFERLRDLRLHPSPRSFECVIRAAAKAGQTPIVEMLWVEMREAVHDEEAPLMPSLFTYNVLMRALAEGGGRAPGPKRTQAAQQVLRAFDEAVALDVRLDLSAFKHALRASDLTGDWRRALELLGMMREAAIQPDELVYVHDRARARPPAQHCRPPPLFLSLPDIDDPPHLPPFAPPFGLIVAGTAT
jgi:tetratricopeptide (TPR) repeat protein